MLISIIFPPTLDKPRRRPYNAASSDGDIGNDDKILKVVAVT